ncbi:hypothetical protein GYMLUDRAFT_46706 [Collybiopsis luxurians FD-317 M1]|uniref:SPRY domain-containing protein n=1 Tax=Collybiopsis luxurians FD-317 M1 TaxID=944289 RepID=A0A0D0B1S3_9AGAR|nr:hypothetical protein GYMLUDRAFT_46706 [Collybiopsis luxurians FD-317 M1]
MINQGCETPKYAFAFTMISLFKHLKSHTSRNDDAKPPEWTPAPEISHTDGKYDDAPDEEYQDGISYCLTYPLCPPALVPTHAIDRIRSEGARAWGLDDPFTPLPLSSSTQDPHYFSTLYLNRFSGFIRNIPPDSKSQSVVRVSTNENCKDYCLLSDLPIAAGLYDTFGRRGVYFEVVIHEMDAPTSFVTVGTACKPYPTFRHPGWNRQSTGWHLDDLRKFFEDSDGGRDYTDNGHPLPLPWKSSRTGHKTQFIPNGSTIGCGYIFQSGSIFYTYNGLRLPNAFEGVHLPRGELDVFAAVGVCGKTRFDVNFGGETFRWVDGNTWEWRVEGVARRLETGSGTGRGDELPAYSS